MTKRHFLSAALIAGLLGPASARADFWTYTSVSRTLESEAAAHPPAGVPHPQPSFVTRSSDEIGLWSDTALAISGAGGISTRGESRTSSRLESMTIEWDASARADVDTWWLDAQTYDHGDGDVGARAALDTTFHISRAVRLDVTQDLNVSWLPEAHATVDATLHFEIREVGADGHVFLLRDEIIDADTPEGTTLDALDLAPGSYRVTAEIVVEMSTSSPNAPDSFDSTVDVDFDLDLHAEPLAPAIEVVDRITPEFLIESIPLDQRLAAGGIPRLGFVADGASRLLVRTEPLPCPAELTFSVYDDDGSSSSISAGKIEDPFTGASGSTLTIDTQPDPLTGMHRGYVVIRSPVSFVRLEHETQDRANVGMRPVNLEYRQANGPPAVTPLSVHRVPITFVHGLESEDDVWRLDLESDPRYFTHAYDYSDRPPGSLYRRHSRSFVENRFVVRYAIRETIERFHVAHPELACVQSAVVAHSMGGILARVYMTGMAGLGHETGYRRPDNFEQGDLYRLTTVDTPHRGSPTAVITVNLDNTYTAYGRATYLVSEWWYGMDPLGGAVRDLRPDSPAMQALNFFPFMLVPMHALVGTGGTNQDFIPHQYYVEAYTVAQMCYPTLPDALALPVLFGFDEHDAVVTRSSQAAGLVEPFITVIDDGDEGLHTPMINEYPSGIANARLCQLLDEPFGLFGSYWWQGFLPPGTTGPILPPPCDIDQVVAPIAAVVDFFTAPGGARTAIVTVDLGPFVATNVTIATSWGAVASGDAPPYIFTIPVPEEAAGQLEVAAIAVNDTGAVASSDPVGAFLLPDALPTGIDASDLLLLDADASAREIRVTGAFTDGIDRDVASPGFGTTYVVADRAIATVDENGRVIARGLGTTTITVELDGFVDVTAVEVASVAGDASGDGVIGPDDFASFTSCYSGAIGTPEFVTPSYTCAEPFDFDRDGDVDCDDADVLLGLWNDVGAPPPLAPCTTLDPADIDQDGTVGFGDLLALLAAWGPCPDCLADLDGDGTVGFDDLLTLLASWD